MSPERAKSYLIAGLSLAYCSLLSSAHGALADATTVPTNSDVLEISIADGEQLSLQLKAPAAPIAGVAVGPYVAYVLADGDGAGHLILRDPDGSFTDYFDAEVIEAEDAASIGMERHGDQLRLTVTHAAIDLQLDGWNGLIYAFCDTAVADQGTPISDNAAAQVSGRDEDQSTTQPLPDYSSPSPSFGPSGASGLFPPYNPMDLPQNRWIARLNERPNGTRTIIVANAHLNSEVIERRKRGPIVSPPPREEPQQ